MTYTPDGWLETAHLLHKTVLEDPAVLHFDASRRYETRGRGPTVAGLHLALVSDQPHVRLGLVLDARYCLGTPLREVTARIQQALRACWSTQDLRTLFVHIEVLDLQNPLPPHSSNLSLF